MGPSSTYIRIGACTLDGEEQECEVLVECDVGDVAMGGGSDRPTNLRAHIVYSKPHSSGAAWSVKAVRDHSLIKGGTVQGYVICLDRTA
jgi:hypothetical protein